VWRCEWNAFLGSCSLYPAKLRTAGVFVPSFWDKTWDKTPFVSSPKMAENLVFFDRPKEPRDRIQLPPAASLVRNTGFDTVAVAQKMAGGTMSSNPASSSRQSVSAVNAEAVREKARTLAAFCGWLGT
jgi:hypothetical protein